MEKKDQRKVNSHTLRPSGFRLQTGLRGGAMADSRAAAFVHDPALARDPALAFFDVPTSPPLSRDNQPLTTPRATPYADLLQECSAWATWKPSEDADRVAPQTAVEDKSRFWELDAARGWAILMMVVKHLMDGWISVLNPALASNFFRLWIPIKFVSVAGICGCMLYAALKNSDVVSRVACWLAPGHEALWREFLAAAGALAFSGILSITGSGAVAFLFIMGVAMAVRGARAKNKAALQKGWLRRGLMLMALGVTITAASLVIIPQAPVLFGIMHVLGLSTILAMPFFSLPDWVTTAVALAILAIGTWVTPHLPVQTYAWLWLGLFPQEMLTVDYAPLFPNLGAVLLGLVIGKTLYEKGVTRKFNLPDFSKNRVIQALSQTGRHTLAIYMAQVPLYLSGMAAVL